MATETPPAMEQPNLAVYHNQAGNKTGVVFVHGFGGDLEQTWGAFPQFLARDSRLEGWDILSLGYPTHLTIDLVGIWSADPNITTLADLLRATLQHARIKSYASIALIAHSMGGLVVQRALIDASDLANRVRYVFLFGTPSGGLKKASLITRLIRLKREIEDMADDSIFVKKLREDWTAKFAVRRPFGFLSVAGASDEFVPRSSSIDVFDDEFRAVVPGNHLTIVKPAVAVAGEEQVKNLGVELVIEKLMPTGGAGGKMHAARRAAELGPFHQTVAELWDKRDKLTSQAVVQLALALRETGRAADAVQLLEQHAENNTDAMGTLAGQFKRIWLLEQTKDEAERALSLYRRGFAKAQEAQNWAQAFYHGINVAFMLLVYEDNHPAAQAMARDVLAICQKAPKEKWRYATEGDANLILQNEAEALQSYEKEIKRHPPATTREIDSIYAQAVLIGGKVGSEQLAEKLDKVFRDGIASRITAERIALSKSSD